MILNFKHLIEYNLCKFPNIYLLLRFLAGSQDWEKRTFIKNIRRNWTIVEIGANQGYFTSLFQKLVGKKGAVHAFEPIPSTFELLQNSMPRYPQNYFLFNSGTWKESVDQVEFHLPVNDHGQATMVAHSDSKWQSQEIRKVICKVVRLDEFEPDQKIRRNKFHQIRCRRIDLTSLKGAKCTSHQT